MENVEIKTLDQEASILVERLSFAGAITVVSDLLKEIGADETSISVQKRFDTYKSNVLSIVTENIIINSISEVDDFLQQSEPSEANVLADEVTEQLIDKPNQETTNKILVEFLMKAGYTNVATALKRATEK